MIEEDLISLLDGLHISYQRKDHPAVYTVDEADLYLKNAPGIGTKNLFLRSEKNGSLCLLMVEEGKRVDINRLGKQLGLGKLRFGEAEKMEETLGIKPGSVTLLALVNDTRKRVRVLIDRDLWQQDGVQCHPLTNTATLVISPPDLELFLRYVQHDFELIEIPLRE